jgi:hypothetical protein
MPSRRRYYVFQLLAFLTLGIGIASVSHAQNSSHFGGFYADVGFGYRDVNASTTSSLSVNGKAIPSSITSGQPSNTVSVLTAGYNFPVFSDYVLGVGANIAPASGQAQSVQVQALNQTIPVSGIKPLYNYSFFLSPGLVMGDGLAYLKAGTQTQVNNSNTSANFYGYLLGLGYKHLVYQSVYIFGEANYASYGAQTNTKTVTTSGRSINASVTTHPQGARYLIGLGYQF